MYVNDFVNGLDYAGVFDTYYNDASSCYSKLEGQVGIGLFLPGRFQLLRKLEGQVVNLPVNPW